MRPEVAAGEKPQAVWLSDEYEDAFADPAWDRLENRASRSPVVHVPQRRERPRERRVSTRRSSRTSRTSRGDPDDGEADHLRVIPLATFRRVLRHALGKQT